MQELYEKCPKCKSTLYGEVNASNEKGIYAIIYCLRCGYEREERESKWEDSNI